MPKAGGGARASGTGAGERCPPPALSVCAVPGVPLVEPGDDLGALLPGALDAAGIALRDGDVAVIAQKIVSKAQGRYAWLDEHPPSPRARALAEATGKDPRLVEIILSESNEIVAHGPSLIIAEHRSGHVMANAGVDRSNIRHPLDRERVLMLPEDSDRACATLKGTFERRYRVNVAVLISDSVGRPWRNGTTGLALGCAGLPALEDLRGQPDLHGRPLEVSLSGLADALAAAAALVMGEGDEALPFAVVRGARWRSPPAPARALLRPREQDLFRR